MSRPWEGRGWNNLYWVLSNKNSKLRRKERKKERKITEEHSWQLFSIALVLLHCQGLRPSGVSAGLSDPHSVGLAIVRALTLPLSKRCRPAVCTRVTGGVTEYSMFLTARYERRGYRPCVPPRTYYLLQLMSTLRAAAAGPQRSGSRHRKKLERPGH